MTHLASHARRRGALRRAPWTLALAAFSLTAALGAGAAAAATDAATTPAAKSDGLGAVLSDSAITAKVKGHLIGEKVFREADIHVNTVNGVVTLSGSTRTWAIGAAAAEASRSVAGVKSVDNQLQTAAGSSAPDKARQTAQKAERVVSDSWITTKVKSEILANSVSKGFDVKVSTLHGVVMLKGALANQDAVDQVKAIAQAVQGVKGVDTTTLVVAGG